MTTRSEDFAGLSVALTTPFKDGHVDYDRLAEQVEFQVAAGTTCVVPVGTTGESPTLSHEEHDQVIAQVVRVASGRIKVMAGTGSNSTDEALRLTKAAEHSGADAALVVAPYYNKPTQEGMYRHFTAVAEAVQSSLAGSEYDADARLLWFGPAEVPIVGKGTVVVVTAGTADLPVAYEAVGVARRFGNKVELLVDVGVAGVHRLLASVEQLRSARVLIVVAGMEGALPSVVGGLVDKPVIAVPTSVGYGAAFDGLAALLGMLTSCSSNVAVVNIDNGFGAANVATLINRL